MPKTNEGGKKRTVVFDLDGSLETPYCSESQASQVHYGNYGLAFPSGCEHWSVPVKYVKPAFE